MIKLFFILIVPAIAGFITEALGVGWFSGDVALAACINLPICAAGAWVRCNL